MLRKPVKNNLYTHASVDKPVRLFINDWIYAVELQDHFSLFCSAVTGRFCSAFTMVVHRKVSAETFDNLLLLVNSLQMEWNLPTQRALALYDYLFPLSSFPTVCLHSKKPVYLYLAAIWIKLLRLISPKIKSSAFAYTAVRSASPLSAKLLLYQ